LPENFHLAFVGRGYDRLIEALPHGLRSSRLHYGHACAADAIVPAIRSADLGLVLYEPRSINYRYALPNGFFQTVAAGLPLVRLPLVEIEGVIGTRSVGVRLETLDPAEMAAAILHCTDNAQSLRRNIAALNRGLGWRFEADRLKAVIEQAMRFRRERGTAQAPAGR
jgi:hypothetical protein